MVFYFVQRGETLFAIAKRYQTTVHAIVAANRLEDPNAICPGQALIIPRPGEVPSPPPGGIVHLVRPGETLFHLAQRFGTPMREILKANQIAHPEFLVAGQQLVIPEPTEPGEDWPMLGRTPGRSAVTAVSLEGVPVWSWGRGPRCDGGWRPSAPVVRYERIYAGLRDGQYHALDRESGAIKWSVPACLDQAAPAPPGAALVEPAVYDGLAYLCGPDGSLQAVDAHTGRQVWRVALEGEITGAPAVADGLLFLGTRNEQVYAIEGKTGAIAWKLSLKGAIVHPVALGDDHLFAVTEAGRMWAVESITGSPCWEAPVDAAYPPVFAELLVIVGGVAYDPTTGEQVWAVEDPPCSPAVRVDQVIYPGRVLDLFTGSERVAAAPPQIPVSAHLVAGDLQILVTAENRLEAWELTTGERRWAVQLEAPAVGTPAVGPGGIFLALADGSVVAYQLKPEPER